MPTEITIKAYKYAELNERAKLKVNNWYREHSMIHEWWDCVYDNAKEDGEALGFSIDDIRFSGFSSQGDGAHWTGHIHMPTFLKAHLDERSAYYGEDIILLELWEQGWIFKDVSVQNKSYRYSHSGGMELYEYPTEWVTGIDDDAVETLEHGVMAGARVALLRDSFTYGVDQRVNEWCDEALTQAKAFADEIYRRLSVEYDYLTSDESIADVCDVNDWLFNEEGEMV
jgi:hypothetical protein